MAVTAILKIDIENRFFGHNSSTICPISAKFCMKSRMACRQGLHDKNCKFLKSKMADRHHFENRKIAISQ